jgi:hypothetical protein
MANTTSSAVADPYVEMHEALVTIHRALGAEFASVLAIDPADRQGLVSAAGRAGGFLLAHHHAESTFLFPALRRSGILRSTDVSFLEGLDREHHALHEICERLVGEARAPHPRGRELLVLSKEIAMAFGLHIRGEEKGLAPERLCTMITAEGLAELGRELEADRGGSRATG